MKKLIFLLLTLLSITAYGQTDQNRTSPLGNNPAITSSYNKRSIVDANLKASLTLFIPKGATPTLNNAKDSVGAIFFKINPSSDTSFYVYHGSNNWVRYAKFQDIEDALEAYTPLPNIGVTGNALTVNGDSVIVGSGTYRINKIIYSQSGRIIANIPYSASGTQRYITFIGTEAGTVDTLGGVADSIAVYPTVADNQANLGSVLVGDGVIGQPSTPTELIAGGAITSLATVGFNPGTNLTAAEFIRNTFYQSQAPTANLTGGQTLEYRAATSTDFSLTYTAGRQSGTQPLSSIVVNGISKTFTQPNAPGTVGGNQTVSVPSNVNTTYTLVVTTVDSKTATSSTTFTFLRRKFWGRSALSSPTEAIIESVAGGGSELNGSKNKSGFTITSSGSNYVFYAYPSSYGLLTSITVGGFESFNAFTRTSVTVTNSLGYEETYYVYTSNNTFSATTPSITVQ